MYCLCVPPVDNGYDHIVDVAFAETLQRRCAVRKYIISIRLPRRGMKCPEKFAIKLQVHLMGPLCSPWHQARTPGRPSCHGYQKQYRLSRPRSILTQFDWINRISRRRATLDPGTAPMVVKGFETVKQEFDLAAEFMTKQSWLSQIPY